MASPMTLVRAPIALLAATVALAAATPALLLGLPFWGLALLLRGVRRTRASLGPRTVPWQDIVEYAPVVGWQNRPYLDAHGDAGAPFGFVTDRDGWRAKTELEHADVVALGDSFAFGHGMDERAFFGNLDVGVRIKAIGADGYNLVQELLWLERLAPRLRGKLVAWFVFYGNDLYDNLQPAHARYRMPFVRPTGDDGGWEVVTSHISPEPWSFGFRENYASKLAEICSPTLLSRRAFSASRFLLAKGREVCARADADLVVLGIPDRWLILPRGRERLEARLPRSELFDPAYPDRELARICWDLEVRFVALRDHLTPGHYLPSDGHWNARGHRLVADLLAELHHQRTPTPGQGHTALRLGERRPAGAPIASRRATG